MGLYFVSELIRNVCLLLDDSIVSKVIFACIDIAFLVILNLQRTTSMLSFWFRFYTFVSFCQTMTTLVYKILDKQPEWLSYLNISIASVDAIVVALMLGSELITFSQSKRFADAMNRKQILGSKTP